MPALLSLSRSVFLAQASSPGTSLGFGVVLVVLVALAVVAVLLGRLRAQSANLKQLATALQTTQEAQRALESKEREQQKKLEERALEIQNLKQDTAAARKKHHQAQEEAKRLRESMRSQAKERDKMLTSRPAFEPTTKDAPPKPVDKEKTAPDKPAKPAVAADANQELKTRAEELQGKLADLEAALQEERQRGKQMKIELTKTRRWAEQLRRVDVVSKSKLEVLEEKAAHLGRQYYDAVSELAALRGEVVPPPASTQAATAQGDAREQGEDAETTVPQQHETNESPVGGHTKPLETSAES